VTALRATAIAFALLALFGLFGEAVLGAVGISMPAFRIAGGLLLFLLAVDMLFEKRTERRDKQMEGARPDPTVFPLATPLVAGPGALAAMVLYAGQVSGSPGGLLLLHLILLAVLGLTLGSSSPPARSAACSAGPASPWSPACSACCSPPSRCSSCSTA
jgi:multiple antibiotic resistance protein